jgi:hypothetical protein
VRFGRRRGQMREREREQGGIGEIPVDGCHRVYRYTRMNGGFVGERGGKCECGAEMVGDAASERHHAPSDDQIRCLQDGCDRVMPRFSAKWHQAVSGHRGWETTTVDGPPDG